MTSLPRKKTIPVFFNEDNGNKRLSFGDEDFEWRYSVKNILKLKGETFGPVWWKIVEFGKPELDMLEDFYVLPIIIKQWDGPPLRESYHKLGKVLHGHPDYPNGFIP